MDELQIIREFEGLSLECYLCPAGKLTVGYGHRVTPADGLALGERIDEARALQFLEDDIGIAAAAVARLVTVPLTDGQRASLVSFLFNVGAGAFARSTLRRRLNAGDFDGAAREFGRWIYGGGRELPGLVRRRKAEARLFDRENVP